MKIDEIQTRITELNKDVIVRVLVPAIHEKGEQCAVLYMNDGQDLFEDSQTYHNAESLRLKQYYEDYEKFMPNVILVAICAPENSAERTAEYSPFEKNFVVPKGKNFETRIEGKGKEYLQWVVTELKPLIDAKYSTKSQREYTGIGGYSTGGLNCLYGALAFPDTFSRLVCMSPAVCIWMDLLQKALEDSSTDHLKYVYLDVGTNEFGRMTTSEEFLNGTKHLNQFFTMRGLTTEQKKFVIYEDAEHKQKEWRNRFPDALRWAFQDCK